MMANVIGLFRSMAVTPAPDRPPISYSVPPTEHSLDEEGAFTVIETVSLEERPSPTLSETVTEKTNVEALSPTLKVGAAKVG